MSPFLSIFLLLAICVINGSADAAIGPPTFVVPSIVRQGAGLPLKCVVDPHSDRDLKDLTWYWNSVRLMSYDFVYSVVKITDSLPIGIHIDPVHSGRDWLLLKNVTLATSGTFKCSIRDNFGNEVVREAYMRVKKNDDTSGRLKQEPKTAAPHHPHHEVEEDANVTTGENKENERETNDTPDEGQKEGEAVPKESAQSAGLRSSGLPYVMLPLLLLSLLIAEA